MSALPARASAPRGSNVPASTSGGGGIRPGMVVQVNGASGGGKPSWRESVVVAVWATGAFRVQ
eukprot:6647226-Prymnesium_polylepis.1